MTKILSQLLEAKEPFFRQTITRLEKASGGSAHDIQLTSELLSASRTKIAELGLDPKDTTGPEFYEALKRKFEDSDKVLLDKFKLDICAPGFLDSLVSEVRKLFPGIDCFALKSSAAKKMLRASPPKRAMKALGYRSLDSFLKHEPLVGVYVAAKICESPAWWQAFMASYKRLSPSDFEPRHLTITPLVSSRWQRLATDYISRTRYNIFSFGELGVIAVLPLEDYHPGMVTALVLLMISQVNELAAASSYLRLHQVKADFGSAVVTVASEPLEVDSPLEGYKLSWRTVYDFVASSRTSLEPELGDQPTALAAPADILANLSPELEFWRGTSHLAYHYAGQAVSLNPLDVAINYINNFSYENRINSHFRQNLWQKFWQGYLQAEVLEEKLLTGLRRELGGPEVALEPILAE